MSARNRAYGLRDPIQAFADALIDVIPTQAPAANTQFVSSIQSHGYTIRRPLTFMTVPLLQTALSGTLTLAIQTYSS
ncbi:hypothetical protein NUW54_g12556 [Trametes sanguinea]|uniref:Uncharacterized protein n=1 Tax=Trametes sanguinea TaxID=158606 RepID=A0ACC1MYE1_9APHY|nr:hypothetical protein NUW54_g12556 [Trametes sanguinea]